MVTAENLLSLLPFLIDSLTKIELEAVLNHVEVYNHSLSGKV